MTLQEALQYLSSKGYALGEIDGEQKWIVFPSDYEAYGPWDERELIFRTEEVKEFLEDTGEREFELGQAKYVEPWPLRES